MKKRSSTAGFTLVEAVVSIAILGIIAGPLGSSLVLAHRLNGNSQAMLEARADVTSAVEQLMAAGISKTDIKNKAEEPDADFKIETSEDSDILTIEGPTKDPAGGPRIRIEIKAPDEPDPASAVPDEEASPTPDPGEAEEQVPYYEVTVSSIVRDDVSIKTQIHSVDPSEDPEPAPEATEP